MTEKQNKLLLGKGDIAVLPWWQWWENYLMSSKGFLAWGNKNKELKLFPRVPLSRRVKFNFLYCCLQCQERSFNDIRVAQCLFGLFVTHFWFHFPKKNKIKNKPKNKVPMWHFFKILLFLLLLCFYFCKGFKSLNWISASTLTASPSWMRAALLSSSTPILSSMWIIKLWRIIQHQTHRISSRYFLLSATWSWISLRDWNVPQGDQCNALYSDLKC